MIAETKASVSDYASNQRLSSHRTLTTDEFMAINIIMSNTLSASTIIGVQELVNSQLLFIFFTWKLFVPVADIR